MLENAQTAYVALSVGWISDRYVLRGPVLIGSILLSMIGFIVLYTQTKAGVAYAGAVLAAMGAYPTIAIDLAWAGSASGGDVRKGTTTCNKIYLDFELV